LFERLFVNNGKIDVIAMTAEKQFETNSHIIVRYEERDKGCENA